MHTKPSSGVIMDIDEKDIKALSITSEFADKGSLELLRQVLSMMRDQKLSDNKFSAGSLFVIARMVVNMIGAMVMTGGNPQEMPAQQLEDTELYVTLYAYNILRLIRKREETRQPEKLAAEMFEKLTGRAWSLEKVPSSDAVYH